MIRVITIEREYGSGGADIAKQVAGRLGWKLWDQLLTNEIARLMDCDNRVVEEREEKRDPLFYRLFKAFMRGSFEGSLNAPRLKMADTECIREVTERVVRATAEGGKCVIVGRGSAYYLQSRRDAFHVFVYAPFDAKVRRLQARREERRAKPCTSPKPWTATGQLSSSNISASNGQIGSAFIS
jgi:cytidylate kinase